MDPEVAAEYGGERIAEIAQGGFAARAELLLGDDDPNRATVLHHVEPVDAGRVVANALRRFLGDLHFGDQVALRCVPTREVDPGCFADDAASSVAPDEILRPHRPAVGQLDVDASVVLGEPRHLTSVVHPYRQLGDPVAHDPLDVVLPDAERIGMTRREITHVQHVGGDHDGLSDLTLGEEPVGDPTLIEHFDGARVKPAGP